MMPESGQRFVDALAHAKIEKKISGQLIQSAWSAFVDIVNTGQLPKQIAIDGAVAIVDCLLSFQEAGGTILFISPKEDGA